MKNVKKFFIGVVGSACLSLYLFYCYNIKKNQDFNPGQEVVYYHEVSTPFRVFFHGSPNRNIDTLEPRSMWERNKDEGDVIFATPHIGLAAAFMSSHDKSRGFSVKMHSFDGGPYIFICDNKENFLKLDQGGAIYILPTESFYYDIGLHGMSRIQFLKKSYNPEMGGLDEWVSRKAISPLSKIEFSSVYEAMLDLGVQVYFVEKEVYQKIRVALKDKSNPLKRRMLLKSLTSENQKMNKNIIPLFDYSQLL